MYKLKVQQMIDASHQLPDTPELISKGCARLHGHTYYFIVEIESEKLNNAGMVVDFKAVKNIIDEFDHRHINDVFKEKGFSAPPTAENIAYYIAHAVSGQLSFKNVSVSVCEGYKGRERSSWATFNLKENI